MTSDFFGLHLTYLPTLITFCSTYPPTLNYAVRFCQIPFQPLPDYYMQHVPDIISFKISYLLCFYNPTRGSRYNFDVSDCTHKSYVINGRSQSLKPNQFENFMLMQYSIGFFVFRVKKS